MRKCIIFSEKGGHITLYSAGSILLVKNIKDNNININNIKLG